MRKQSKARQRFLQQKALKKARRQDSPRPLHLQAGGYDGASGRWRLTPHALSLSPAQLAGSRALNVLESVDGFANMRNMLRQIAESTGEWAGIPMPLDNARLVIEPTYPKAAALMNISREPPESEADSEEHPQTLRNTFWSWHRHARVAVWEEAGKIAWGPLSVTNHMDLMLETLSVADAWGIEQEHHAVQTLGTLLRHRQFKQYLMTGMFGEQSRRSGVHYLFRRLRPTIAFTTRSSSRSYNEHAGDKMRILAALCLHPIGYYEGSWAGAMTPTDDVVAHLMLMRGDEHLFWRRSNQHPAWAREAAIT